MSKNQLQLWAHELTAELEEFRKIEAVIAEARSRLGTREPDKFELYALGGILHDVYQGTERVCLYVAKAIDRKAPVGPAWHRDLLDQMANPFPKIRPPVIQLETAALLQDYRRFRHVARNIYGFTLDWIRIKPLLDNADKTIAAFVADIERFISFLRLTTSDSESEA